MILEYIFGYMINLEQVASLRDVKSNYGDQKACVLFMSGGAGIRYENNSCEEVAKEIVKKYYAHRDKL